MSSDSSKSISCFLVQENASGKSVGSIQPITYEQYPPGELVVRPTLSSLNYKDALAATGHRGVVRKFPHIPGIDMAGIVQESTDSRFSVGSEILMMGSGFGSDKWGGWSQRVRLSASEVFSLPDAMSAEQAMALGTAGFTAVQSIEALIAHGIHSDSGKILVSGATGGVGSLATMMLSERGYHVVCLTGKTEQYDWLRTIGAAEIVDRHQLAAEFANEKRPLLSGAYAGAIDTVGGDLLATILKQIEPRGCVTACGMAAGYDLNTTVLPFILRGITLCGIDSAGCPFDERVELWQKIAQQYVPKNLDSIVSRVPLTDINEPVSKMLAGETFGRIVVEIS